VLSEQPRSDALSPADAADALTAAEAGRLVAMINAGRFADVENMARELLERHPNSGLAWKVLGVSLKTRGRDALHALQRAVALLPDDAEARSNLGNALRDQGQLEEAAASYRRALELKPDYAGAHSNLGNVLLDLRRPDDAIASYRRALEIKPDYAQAHNNLANTLRSLGRLDEAAASYRRALALEPLYAEAYNNLGVALRDSGRLDEAAASYRRALEIKPDLAEALSNLAIVQRVQGRIAQAQASCRRALEIDPNAATATVFLAELHADEGQFAEAEALFKRAISIDPDSPQAWSGIARLRKMTADDAAWLAEAQRIAGLPLPPRQEAYLRYAIGKYFDDVKAYDQAFLSVQRANELTKRYTVAHDRQQLTQAVDRMMRFYDRTLINQARIDANPSQRPVFIIGMPRSGTTLAEQILASHPKIAGAGELPFWNDAAAGYKSAARDGGTSGGATAKLAEDYLRLLADLSPNALRVIDKMPANFLFLGLIHSALPNARILHMCRNPIDTCLSIYFQHFEIAYSYANDLEDLAHYYTEYSRVMEHWRSTLPENAILDVPYEGLVEDQEAWSRKMLEFIGLPWDPICLDFHRTERAVITASKWQVRQRISKSSVGRWRNYERFLGPLLRLTESAAS
jgi:tetratricopeptide (TPR) repeat protein